MVIPSAPSQQSSRSTGDSLAESPMSHNARRRLIRSLSIREQALNAQRAGAPSWGFTHTSQHLFYARADLPNPIWGPTLHCQTTRLLPAVALGFASRFTERSKARPPLRLITLGIEPSSQTKRRSERSLISGWLRFYLAQQLTATTHRLAVRQIFAKKSTSITFRVTKR